MKTLFLFAFSLLCLCVDAQIHGWFFAAQGNTFVLDQVGKQSVGAYSTRRLSRNYAGSAMRVRRSSDNTEQDIGFDGSGNLNTTALLSFAGAGNAFVVTWYDQSGNSRNVTQATTANQPQIVNAGALYLLSGRPYLYHDNTDFLQGPDLMGGSTSDFVVFMNIQTYATTSGGFGNYAFKLRADESNRVQVHLPWSDLNIYFDVGAATAPNRLTVSSQFFNATLYQFTFINSVTNSVQAVRKNGTEVGSDASGHTVTTDYLRISQTLLGYLSELIFFETTFTANELKVVEKSQGEHFGITIAN